HDEVLRQVAALAAARQAPQNAPGQDMRNEDKDIEQDSSESASTIENVRIVQQFIEELRSATLENGGLDEDTLDRLRNPPHELVAISDPDIRFSLDIFLSCTNASEAFYNSFRQATLRRFPDCNLLSHHAAKKLVAELSGVIAIEDDMCVNSCHAYVGPL